MINADDLEWIAEQTQLIAERADRAAVFIHRLRSLSDLQAPLPSLSVLHERLREWADELDYLNSWIGSDAGWMSRQLRETLEGDVEMVDEVMA